MLNKLPFYILNRNMGAKKTDTQTGTTPRIVKKHPHVTFKENCVCVAAAHLFVYHIYILINNEENCIV